MRSIDARPVWSVPSETGRRGGGVQGWGRYSKKGPTCSCSDLKERTEQRDLQHLDSAAAVENVGARTVGRPEPQNSPSAKMSLCCWVFVFFHAKERLANYLAGDKIQGKACFEWQGKGGKHASVLNITAGLFWEQQQTSILKADMRLVAQTAAF